MRKHESHSVDEPTATADRFVTIEAESVEKAMEQVAAQVGDHAEIVEAKKLHRGGIGGFFARESVQLTVRPPAPALKATTSAPAPPFVAGAEADTTFGEMLRREIDSSTADLGLDTFLHAVGWAPDGGEAPEIAVPAPQMTLEEMPPPVRVGPEAVFADGDAMTDSAPAQILVDPAETTVPAAPAPAAEAGDIEFGTTNDSEIPEAPTVPDTACDDWRLWGTNDAPDQMGPVSWGGKELVRHGIPGRIVNAVAHLDERDDLGWINGVAASVAGMCGPLPTNDAVVVGPHADRLAGPLGIPLVGLGEAAPYDGSFASVLAGDPTDRSWLEFVRGNRDLHLVIGEDDLWRDLLVADPAVVSWVGDRSIVDALYVAATLGAQLGFGTVDGFAAPLVRATPIDVALAVRRVVGRR